MSDVDPRCGPPSPGRPQAGGRPVLARWSTTSCAAWRRSGWPTGGAQWPNAPRRRPRSEGFWVRLTGKMDRKIPGTAVGTFFAAAARWPCAACSSRKRPSPESGAKHGGAATGHCVSLEEAESVWCQAPSGGNLWRSIEALNPILRRTIRQGGQRWSKPPLFAGLTHAEVAQRGDLSGWHGRKGTGKPYAATWDYTPTGRRGPGK